MDQSKNPEEVSLKKIVPNTFRDQAFFDKNESGLYIFKKTQKISAAVYLITEYISPEDPLRYETRSLSLDVVKKSLKSSKGNSFPFEVLESLGELMTLLEIAYFAKLISSMNYTLLQQEIHKTSEFLKGGDFEMTVYENMRTMLFPLEEKEPMRTPFKGQKDMSFLPPIYKATSRDISHEKDKSTRTMQIIDIIKSKEPVTIKDISLIVSDCSEKTIQRELSSLVSSGVLKKDGERRWSKYSLRR